LGDQTYTSGTLTLTQTDAFTNGTSNNRRFTFSGGVMALGSSNRNLTLVHTASGYCIDFATAGAITGSGIVSIINGLANGNYNNAYFGSSGAHTGFTGTLRFTDGSGIFSGAASTGCFTGANIIIDGPNCILSVGVSGAGIGGTGKTLTINENVSLGRSGFSAQINPNVALGSVLRTLTVLGNTTMSGTVTGTAGVTVAGGTQYTYLVLSGNSSALSGPCVVSSGDFQIPSTNRFVPSTLEVQGTGRFQYYGGSADYNYPVTPTGAGIIGIVGNFATNGVTFPLTGTGNLASFNGRVQAIAVSSAGSQLCKIRINELPASLGFVGYAVGTTTMSGIITYLGTGQAKATSIVIDSEDNGDLTRLTGGTYSLLSSGSGAIALSGTVTRTNSAAGSVVAGDLVSARMNLTLGGSNTADNTLSGDISEVGTNSAILGLTKVDAGRWVLSGANSSHTGIHTVSAGTLSAQSAKALGSATSAGGVTISGTGVLELAGGITLNKSATAFTINQTSPITSVGDNTVQTAGITLGGTTTFEVTTGNRLAISNSGAITDGASTFGVTKTGDGELALAAFANTYDGAVTVTAGTLAIGSVGALGTGVATVQLTGNLKYTGTGETLSRATQLNGSAPSLEASGSGALTVSTLSSSTSAKTLTLKGSNTGANTITSTLADNTGALSLAKEDAGKWVVTTRTYSGTTAVNAGTLRCESTNSATTTGAVTIGASGTVELVTNTLASSGAGNGEVLGTGNVTVNGGTIKTRGGTTQKGQVRYGGNLTFGAGSSLYIGAAA
jgi:autotransporter-associated beta strand protein